MTAEPASILDFVREAESCRQNGDALEAIRLAEAGLQAHPGELLGRIVLALAHIDLGDVEDAREVLSLALPQPAIEPEPALPEAVDDDELETAFAEAESDPEEMMDANRVVEQTLRAAELDAPEPGFDISSHPTYATESMAALLDGQGREDEAHALRQTLGADASLLEGDEPAPPLPAGAGELPDQAEWLGPDHAKRLQVVATLEGWLYNLRRNAEVDSSGRAGGAA